MDANSHYRGNAFYESKVDIIGTQACYSYFGANYLQYRHGCVDLGQCSCLFYGIHLLMLRSRRDSAQLGRGTWMLTAFNFTAAQDAWARNWNDLLSDILTASGFSKHVNKLLSDGSHASRSGSMYPSCSQQEICFFAHSILLDS